MQPIKKGRPPGLKKLPPLHPNTVFALAGRGTVTFTEDGAVGAFEAAPPSKRQTREAKAAMGATIEPRLVELALSIVSTSGCDEFRDLRNRDLDKLAHVSKIAAALGDVAFFEQVAFAMRLADKCGGKPVRLIVLRSWIEARKVSDPPLLANIRAGAKYQLGRIDPESPEGKLFVLDGYIGDDYLRDHLKALGLKWVSRLSGKK